MIWDFRAAHWREKFQLAEVRAQELGILSLDARKHQGANLSEGSELLIERGYQEAASVTQQLQGGERIHSRNPNRERAQGKRKVFQVRQIREKWLQARVISVAKRKSSNRRYLLQHAPGLLQCYN